MEIEVAAAKAFDLSGPTVYGPIGRPLSLGLPDSFAAAAAEGISALGPTQAYSGVIRVAGGAIDVDSSPIAFRFC